MAAELFHQNRFLATSILSPYTYHEFHPFPVASPTIQGSSCLPSLVTLYNSFECLSLDPHSAEYIEIRFLPHE